MLKTIEMIALIKSEKAYIAYLFEKSTKHIIPVKISGFTANALIAPINQYKPNIYNTLKRMVCGLGANFLGITIYRYDSDIFYAYANVEFQNKHLEFNISVDDALNVAKEFEKPIYIKDELLNTCGIKVSKKILRDALREN